MSTYTADPVLVKMNKLYKTLARAEREGNTREVARINEQIDRLAEQRYERACGCY